LVVDAEIVQPTNWTLEFQIPFQLFEEYIGALGKVAGQTWRGNFFKCAEENSHPHWAAWSPVDEFNFHLPRCFGELQFA
jgi:Carbohydrate-binding family 9